MVGGFILLAIIFHLKSIEYNQQFTEFIGNNLFLFSILLSVVFGGGGFLWFTVWYRNKANPKYIWWDDNGIYIVNGREKEEHFSWDEVKRIFKCGKYAKMNKKVPGYFLDLRESIGPRFLNEEIGRKLKEYYVREKWTNSEN